MTARIENSDRGITITKSLAWTMIVGLVGGGLWLGINIATLTTKMDEIGRASAIATVERASIDVRVRNVEVVTARAQEQYTAIINLLSRIDGRLDNLERKEIKP